MKVILFLFTIFAFVLPASAASIEARSEALRTQLDGNNSYHAHLARELAAVAEEEKGQHDIDVARTFMKKAEEEAAMAGGEK